MFVSVNDGVKVNLQMVAKITKIKSSSDGHMLFTFFGADGKELGKHTVFDGSLSSDKVMSDVEYYNRLPSNKK